MIRITFFWIHTGTMPRECAEPVHTCAYLTEPVTSLRTRAQVISRLCRHAHAPGILCTPGHKISGFVTFFHTRSSACSDSTMVHCSPNIMQEKRPQ
jgi:hypothetical protein